MLAVPLITLTSPFSPYILVYSLFYYSREKYCCFRFNSVEYGNHWMASTNLRIEVLNQLERAYLLFGEYKSIAPSDNFHYIVGISLRLRSISRFIHCTKVTHLIFGSSTHQISTNQWHYICYKCIRFTIFWEIISAIKKTIHTFHSSSKPSVVLFFSSHILFIRS